MMGFQEYLNRYPKVARNRAQRLLDEGPCYFLRRNGEAVALMPQTASTDDFVETYVEDMECTCNVYRQKKACPHVAAALGRVERNGGEIPYTDPAPHVYACIERARQFYVKHQGAYSYFNTFTRDVSPFLEKLPRIEKQKVLVELACLYEKGILSEEDFLHCFDWMAGWNWNSDAKEIGKLLFENRKEHYSTIACLVKQNYSSPFTEEETKQILEEMAGDDEIAARCLPILSYSQYPAFTTGQLLDFYRSVKNKSHYGIAGLLLGRLLEEKPPRYELFLEIYRETEEIQRIKVEPEVIEKMYQAGYRDQMQAVVEHAVSQISSLEEYSRLIRVVPHEDFLPGWRKIISKRRSSWNGSGFSEWEVEICFREDPEEKLDTYNLEFYSFDLLGKIISVRPDCREEINQAARRMYRKALKDGNRWKTLGAIELLAKGKDAIAVKYAAAWELDEARPEEMVRLAVVGKRFDCMEKVLPGLKKMEVAHAVG